MKNLGDLGIAATALSLFLAAGCNPAPTWYQDADGDGHGNAGVSLKSASQPLGYVASQDDCDDGNAATYPGRSEIFDAIDNNCDSDVDEGLSGRYVATTGVDAGDCASPEVACQSISYAVSQAVSGDFVYAAAGIYAEMVSVDKPLQFHGANVGRAADATDRGPETVVKGLRNPGSPHPTASAAMSVTVDGFTLDPQGDPSLLQANTRHLVSLFGGAQVLVRNNRFYGGSWDANCDYSCTTMMDSALMIQSGQFVVEYNTFTHFRRPVDIAQDLEQLGSPWVASQPITQGDLRHNHFYGVTSRAIWLVDWGLTHGFSGVTVSDNHFDAGGATEYPGGIIITTGGNVIANNHFTGFGSGVFAQICDGVNNPSNLPNQFTGNRFSGNRSGIQLYVISTSSCPGPVNDVITNNEFAGNYGWAVRWNGDVAPNVLNARCNWWNSASGPQLNTGSASDCPGGDCMTANVEASPWQTTADGPCDGGI